MGTRTKYLLAITGIIAIFMGIVYIVCNSDKFFLALILGLSIYIEYIGFAIAGAIDGKIFKEKCKTSVYILSGAIEIFIVLTITMVVILGSAVISNMRNMLSATYVYVALGGSLIGIMTYFMVEGTINKNMLKNRKQYKKS